MVNRFPRVLRFVQANVEALPDDRCRAVVRIELPEHGLHSGTAEGGHADSLRTVSRAAAEAVSEAFDADGIRIRVRGIQSMEAFGQTIVIASIAASYGGKTQMLLGICNDGQDPSRAAALAVLSATNRFLGAP
jgi:hypothetical protein